jgi:hypothetical protein
MFKITILFNLFLLTQLRVEAKTSNAFENNQIYLQCNDGYGIDIESATWASTGTTWAKANERRTNIRGRGRDRQTREVCSYDTTEDVNDVCEGKQNCNFKATKSMLGEVCGDKVMKLTVVYSCQECSSDRAKRDLWDTKPVFSCDLTSRIAANTNNFECPNPRFIAKHTSTNNYDNQPGAEIFANQAGFARIHSPVARTNLNSVFIKSWFAYEMVNGYCRFSYPASKYNCNPSGRWSWTCTYMGKYFASHDPYTGHYVPSMDVWHDDGGLKF